MYGSARDVAFKKIIAKSFMKRTVSEEVLYYKLSLKDLVINVYGDAKDKIYLQPALVTCSITRNPQTSNDESYGTDTNRLIDFAFLKDDLVDVGVVPEKGDVIVWNESYYEVDLPVEDQYLVGKDPNYSLESGLERFGASLSIVCQSHLTHVNRLNITKSR